MSEDPRASAFLEVARGASMTVAGQLARAEPLLDRSLKTFRARGVASSWDVNMAMYMWVLNRAAAGDFATLSTRLPAFYSDGFDRGDAWLTTNLRLSIAAIRWLVEDKPAEGRADILAALQSWRAGVDIQHWSAAVMLANIDIYEGRPEEALRSVVLTRERARKSTLRFLPVIASRLSGLAFRASVALLARAPSDAGLRQSAHGWRRRAFRDAAGFDLPVVQLVDAGFLHAVGDSARAEELAAAALAGAEAIGMTQYVEFARFRLGQIRGGSHGDALMASSAAWMSGQGIRRPDRFLAMQSPGFADSPPPASLQADGVASSAP